MMLLATIAVIAAALMTVRVVSHKDARIAELEASVARGNELAQKLIANAEASQQVANGLDNNLKQRGY